MELVLLHEINAGTFARLYLAEARGAGGLDRIVAVKILREQWNEQQDVVSRTRDEARLLARLRHKNILRVEDLVEVDGQTAIIMEYVDGLDLKQLVEALHQARQRVPPKVALRIVQETASALEAAYFRIPTGLEKPLRVVHRDIKPSNVMISNEGEVRVLDFGTARSSAVFRSAQTGALRFGSLKYMSPERREGDRGEHASDVYAIGLVLIELLRTDWLPLLPMDLQEHDDVLSQAIAKLPDLGMPNREWDLTLRQALGQMVASDPAGRPNAEQVVKLMREFVEHASGPTLDRFAAETVTPLSRDFHQQVAKGTLSGTRLLVSPIVDAEARRMNPPTMGSGPAPAATPGVRAGLATPGPSVAPAPVQSPSKQVYAPQAPSANNQAFRPNDAPAEESGAGNGTAMAVGAGLFVLIGLGLVILLAAGGLGWWYYQGRAAAIATPTVPEVPIPVTPEELPGDGGAAAVATGQVRIALSGEPAQWIKLDQGGTIAAESRGNLPTANVPIGEYSLSIKVVGRSPVKTTVQVTESGLELSCASDAKQQIKCTGGKKDLLLKP